MEKGKDEKVDPVDEAQAKSGENLRRVRVTCEGTLGPLRLMKGDETDDADYVAVLDQEGQKKVEEVKGQK